MDPPTRSRCNRGVKALAAVGLLALEVVVHEQGHPNRLMIDAVVAALLERAEQPGARVALANSAEHVLPHGRVAGVGFVAAGARKAHTTAFFTRSSWVLWLLVAVSKADLRKVISLFAKFNSRSFTP